MSSFSKRRCEMVQLLADAYYNITDEGHSAPRDIQVLLEHRLRDVLTGVDCPNCVAERLQKELDKAVEQNASTEESR